MAHPYHQPELRTTIKPTFPKHRTTSLRLFFPNAAAIVLLKKLPRARARRSE
ncbi:hypothetical protein ART_3711 [Arthrobacter sp. PAMC 25486]|nr:hypothetical protein ART_3711 [Arthrobacter sp. PAMC 25486]